MFPILHHNQVLRKIHLADPETWWTDDDLGGYEYQKTFNKDFMRMITPYIGDRHGVAVQAGGNCGWLTREISKQFDYTYTCEPHYTSFICLCLNVPGPNVFKMQCCLGQFHALVDISSSPDFPDASAGYVAGGGRIPMITIDSLNLTSCDLIQLDLEGFEYFALKGAKSTIEKYRPLICIEICWNERFGVTNEQIKEFVMDELGYSYVHNVNDDYIFKYIS